MHPTFDAHRFIAAQDRVMEDVHAELAAGRKLTHWMWFVFPQLAALGHSATARHFGLGSLDDARAWLAHPVLAARLRRCCELLLELEGRSAHEVFGHPDDLKLHSSLTLFHLAAPQEPLFREVLRRYCGDTLDERTVALCQG